MLCTFPKVESHSGHYIIFSEGLSIQKTFFQGQFRVVVLTEGEELFLAEEKIPLCKPCVSYEFILWNVWCDLYFVRQRKFETVARPPYYG